MDTIECPGCRRQIVPYIYHYRPAFGSYRYRKARHECRFCGTVLHESGGQLTPFGWIAAFLATNLLAIVIGVFQTFSGGSPWVMSLIMSGFGMYVLYRVIRFLLSKK
ncbi:MAG TPA: hypothetical protein VF472_16345 [Burkholderiaceae bacterium]